MKRAAVVLMLSFVITGTLVSPAWAVRSGHWKGGDIDFRIRDGYIRELTVTSVHTCQAIGTGEYFNDIQTFAPPGRFKIQPDGGVSGQRIRSSAAGTDYYDIRFAMVGEFVNGRFKVVVQTGYKYWDYVNYSSPTNVSCYSQKRFYAHHA